jgi:hypothetical protein
MVLVQHLDELAALGWDSLTLAVERNEYIHYEGGWNARPPQRAWNALMAAIDDLQELELLEERYWWGLEVGTAREVLWGLPDGTATCQVTLLFGWSLLGDESLGRNGATAVGHVTLPLDYAAGYGRRPCGGSLCC